ncbi:hypothetical protein ACIGXF_08380 [Streptomyces sp. NPDC053086]|uniref:hypothetical protein n=1 Tax=unclassified Streptomyces TaxID=2593676 RepID=UPI0037CEC744
MTPIPAHSATAPGSAPGVRRGRHRKPRPRKVLLATGGLALAAGVLSLVRVTPQPGAGAPGTAEAEPRHDPGTVAAGRSANTAATLAATPTALPSATSALGGRSLAPLPTGSPAPGPAGTAPAGTAPAGGAPAPTTASSPAPETVPTGAPDTPVGTPRPTPTASAPRPAPATATPTPAPSRTPAPGHGTPKPDPGGWCVPVIGLCVDVSGG